MSGQPDWKGLDTGVMPVFLGYDQVERMIAALLDSAAAWRPDAVAGIARGGVVPAAMAAGILALPLSFVGHDKAAGAVCWIGPSPSGRRILLVDDCCSTGQTLSRVRDSVLAEGRECLTLVVVHDPDTVRHRPDLSHPMRDLFRLPWERGEATPTGRAAKISGDHADPRAEAPFTGIAFDAALLADDLEGLDVAPARAVLFGTLPEADRPRAAAALARSRYRDLPVLWLADGGAPGGTDSGRVKAEAATRMGCTHFVETDPEQAIAVSAHAPHLMVTWWSPATGRRWIVGAAEHPAGLRA